MLLSGPNMYLDRRGQLIYYQKRTNTAYRLAPEVQNQFKTLQMRWLLVLIAFILLYICFELNIWLSLLITTLLAVAMEWRFRSFLKKLPKTIGFVKAEKARPMDQMIEERPGSLILRAVLYGAFGILLIIDSFISDVMVSSVAMQALCWIVGALALYMCWKYISLLIQKRKSAG